MAKIKIVKYSTLTEILEYDIGTLSYPDIVAEFDEAEQNESECYPFCPMDVIRELVEDNLITRIESNFENSCRTTVYTENNRCLFDHEN
jgi:hypothetical protein